MKQTEYTSVGQDNQQSEQLLSQENQEELCWVLFERERAFHTPYVDVEISVHALVASVEVA